MPAKLLPRPHGKLWRTRMGWHRPLQQIVTPIEAAPLLANRPSPEEVIPYGEYLLLEDHTFVLHRDGTQSFRIHTLTHAWSSNALAQWDQIQRWFHPRQSRSTIRKAVLYLPDGQAKKQKIRRQSDTAGNHYVNLVYTPLQPGVTIEFEEQTDYFEYSSIGPAMWGQFLLQTGPPCRLRRLTVAVARPFELQSRSHHGAPAPKRISQGEYEIYQWERENSEGISQDVLPNGRDFLPWIDFSTIPNWEPVYHHLKEELLPQKKSKAPASEPVGTLLNRLTNAEQSTREKLVAIHQHVASEIRYGRPPADWNNRRVRDPGDILGELRGDCKDKSALLLQILERIQVPAKMAVMLTSEEGRTPYLPSLRFNHAIVKVAVDDEEIWIDPAAGPFSLGDVPRNVQGVPTLLMGANESEMVISPESRPAGHAIRRRYQGRLTSEGAYIADVRVEWSGQPAAELRSKMFDATDDDRRKMMAREIASFTPGAEITNLRYSTLTNLARPLRLKYHVEIARWARRVKNAWIAQMPWEWMLHLNGVLATVERKYPLPSPEVMSLWERHEIQLPEGMRAYGLPFELAIENRWMRYRCRVGTRQGRLIAVRKLQFNEGLISAADYPEFRQGWAEGAEADRWDILLLSKSAPRTVASVVS